MKQFYLASLFSLLTYCGFTQGETNIWYFGSYAGVDFNSGSPVALTNGALITAEGSATMCDKNGNLLFYTDGITVWNRNHAPMPNGFGLLGDPSSAQSAIIVPKPGSTTRFYVFTVAAQGNSGGFCYSEVDLSLNGGLGDVIAATKNTQLFTPAVEKITAVKHANGLYVWVLAHGFNNNRYYAYLVNCNGVSAPITTDVGQVEGWPGWGYLVASPDGTKLATAMRSVGFELLDFNNATGVVSNPVFLGNPNECYGVSFSPDNNVLYGLKINGGSIWQWNLQAGNSAAIIASMIQVGTAGGAANPYMGGALQLGPDGKLYITQYNQPYLSVINNPNTLGVGCNLQQNAVDLLGRNSTLGLPPFIQSYFDTTALINYSGHCSGQPVTFSISGNTAYLDSVKWNFDDAASGSNNVSSLLSPTHVFNTAGNYNVRLIRYLACISDTAYLSVNIIAPVFTTQNITICPGSSLTLPDGNTASNAGTYTSTIPASTGCDSIITTNVTVASFNVDAGNNVSICNGQSTPLNATGGLIYSWTPTNGLSNPNIANPVASPASTTTYTVSTQVEVGNAIVNGDFSAGNTGFTSSYMYKTPPNTTEGQYWVSTNAQAWNGGMAPCGDHTTGSGNMLLVNGATTPNVSIWCQTVSVLPNTTYAFSTWLATVTASNPAQLQFSINGSLLGSVFVAPSVNCQWQQFYTTWNSGVNTSATICIVNQNTIASGNDFAIDDISFAQLCTATDSVTVTVNPVYNQTVNAAICQGETYTRPSGIVVSTAGTYVDNLTTVNGCDSIITTNLTVHPTYAYSVTQTICPSNVYQLPGGNTVNTTGVYVDTLNTINGCDSIITTNLTVVPPAITVSNDTAVCLGSSVQLNASGGLYSYTWTPATGLSNATVANPVATPQQTTTYTVTTQVASGDLIGNGNFSGGNAGFSSNYTYTTNLQPEGTYYVGSNPNTYHGGFSPCPDHTTGSGNMMIVNGAGTPGLNVWCQTINVVPNTDYAFSCWVTSVAGGSPAVLQFSISGSLLGTPFSAPASVCQWQQFYAIWNSGSNTTANICIVNQNTTLGGNDFALDDITFIGLCQATDSVTITVNNPTLTVVDTAICQGITYTFPLGNTSTVSVSDTALLYDQHGCDSTVITNLTVNPSPVTDVYDTICSNQTYTRPSGITVNTTGVYFDTLSTTLHCDSVIITHLTVHPVSTTTVLDTICSGNTYTLPNGNTVAVSGSYPVTLQNQFDCDSMVTTVLTVIQLSLSVNNTNVLCFGGTDGSITSTAGGGVSPYNYATLLNGNPLATNTSGNFQGLSAGNYTVLVSDNFGCTVSGNATVTEPPLLQSSFTFQNVSCFNAGNGSVSITATGGTPAYSFSLNSSSNNSGAFNSLTAGNYNYTVTDANGCTDNGSLVITEPDEVLVTVPPTQPKWI
ncbi:MAG: SprB repeat-containing protein [Chitinophagales bacterium]|nr:SprB repeat-containing protein [Chitinophagales bacterium]